MVSHGKHKANARLNLETSASEKPFGNGWLLSTTPILSKPRFRSSFSQRMMELFMEQPFEEPPFFQGCGPKILLEKYSSLRHLFDSPTTESSACKHLQASP